MPKIRDLGINAIPETMRPPEVGAGGAEGGGGGGEGGCKASYHQCPQGTFQTCTPGTVQMPCIVASWTQCTPTFGSATCYGECPQGTFQNSATCYAVGGICPQGTFQNSATCYAGGEAGAQNSPNIVTAAAAQTVNPAGNGLTREAVAILKQQLQQQIAQLDELAKSIGPTSAEEIDAREQQLKAELEELANRRKGLTEDK